MLELKCKTNIKTSRNDYKSVQEAQQSQMDRTTLFRKSEANDNGRWFRIKSDSLCFR